MQVYLSLSSQIRETEDLETNYPYLILTSKIPTHLHNWRTPSFKSQKVTPNSTNPSKNFPHFQIKSRLFNRKLNRVKKMSRTLNYRNNKNENRITPIKRKINNSPLHSICWKQFSSKTPHQNSGLPMSLKSEFRVLQLMNQQTSIFEISFRGKSWERQKIK